MGLVFKNIFLAIPFYFLWNFLAPIYLFNWPEVYKKIPFWHIVGIFILIAIIRRALFPRVKSNDSFKWSGFKFTNSKQRPFFDRHGENFTSPSQKSEAELRMKDVTPKK